MHSYYAKATRSERLSNKVKFYSNKLIQAIKDQTKLLQNMYTNNLNKSPANVLRVASKSNGKSLPRVTSSSDKDSLPRVVDPTQRVARTMPCKQKVVSQIPRGTGDTVTSTSGPSHNNRANQPM